MAETLFEADERTMDNLMKGPWVRIQEKSYGPSRRIASFNKSGFEKYSQLIDEYECDGFVVAPQDVVQGELKAHFAPDFSKLKRRDAIVEIGIQGEGAFAEGFDYDVFKTFSNVKALTTQEVSFGPMLPTLFPNWKHGKIWLGKAISFARSTAAGQIFRGFPSMVSADRLTCSRSDLSASFS